MPDQPTTRQPGTYQREDAGIEVVVGLAESVSYVRDMFPDEVLAVEAEAVASLTARLEAAELDLVGRARIEAYAAAADRLTAQLETVTAGKERWAQLQADAEALLTEKDGIIAALKPSRQLTAAQEKCDHGSITDDDYCPTCGADFSEAEPPPLLPDLAAQNAALVGALRGMFPSVIGPDDWANFADDNGDCIYCEGPTEPIEEHDEGDCPTIQARHALSAPSQAASRHDAQQRAKGAEEALSVERIAAALQTKLQRSIGTHAPLADFMAPAAALRAALLAPQEAAPTPEIVCLCGSTRFYDAFQQANYDLTMAGKIVLSVGFYPHATAEHGHGEGVGHDSAQKVALDELHKRKIDLSDRVRVLNVGGYIGESTRGEIDYAVAHGKPVEYLAPSSEPSEETPSEAHDSLNAAMVAAFQGALR